MTNKSNPPQLTTNNQQLIISTGFTLIELIIVIAILGVLSIVVLVAINPSERLAQTRDAGRKSTVAQLGNAAQSYYVSNGSNYPDEATWADDLLGYGEIASFPPGIKYPDPNDHCNNVVQPGVDPTYCYDVDPINGFILFSVGESTQSTNKCPSQTTYFVFSSADSKGGTICSTLEPTPWATGTQTYVD